MNKLFCATITKNSLEYLKLKVKKPKRENWCTYAPTILVFCQPDNNVSKTTTALYIHQKMGHESHKKIQ